MLVGTGSDLDVLAYSSIGVGMLITMIGNGKGSRGW